MRKFFITLIALVAVFAVNAPAYAMTYKYTAHCSVKHGHLKGRAAVYQYSKTKRQANLSQTTSWKQSVTGPDITWVYHGFNYNGFHYRGPTNYFRYYSDGTVLLNRAVTVVWQGKRAYLPDPKTSCTLYVN